MLLPISPNTGAFPVIFPVVFPNRKFLPVASVTRLANSLTLCTPLGLSPWVLGQWWQCGCRWCISESADTWCPAPPVSAEPSLWCSDCAYLLKFCYCNWNVEYTLENCTVMMIIALQIYCIPFHVPWSTNSVTVDSRLAVQKYCACAPEFKN